MGVPCSYCSMADDERNVITPANDLHLRRWTSVHLVSEQFAPGQFVPDNSSSIFKQLAPRSFIHYRAKRDVKCMKPRLNAIEIIFRSFYPLPNKLLFVLLYAAESEVRGRIVWGGYRGRIVWHPFTLCLERVSTTSRFALEENRVKYHKNSVGSDEGNSRWNCGLFTFLYSPYFLQQVGQILGVPHWWLLRLSGNVYYMLFDLDWRWSGHLLSLKGQC